MLNISEHKNIILQILKDIYGDREIAPLLGFKGETAAYLFYNLSRFSVDLDFDLLDEKMEEIVFSRVEEIIERYGKIKESRKKRFNLFFLLSYKEEAQNIKIEINRKFFGSKYELESYLGISMLVMKKEDMFGHKIVAMYERINRANRDVYDVWFFLKNNWPINKKIVEQRLKMPFAHFLEACISGAEKLESRNVLHGMGELLDNKSKSWVKENLKKDILFLLKVKLEEEKEFKT
jgi:predicted nucleotidyltransferase component of viral defense system